MSDLEDDIMYQNESSDPVAGLEDEGTTEQGQEQSRHERKKGKQQTRDHDDEEEEDEEDDEDEDEEDEDEDEDDEGLTRGRKRPKVRATPGVLCRDVY